MRYKLAVELINNISEPNQLQVKFMESLKQVKAKYEAFKMKRPDRTFTNLNKATLDEQI